MGFGLMLFGYLAANIMALTFVPKFIGYAIMMWASIKLSDYEIKFKRCLMPLVPASILSVYLFCSDLCGYMNISTAVFSENIVNSVSLVESLLSICFTVLLMLAISAIAKDTGVNKLSFRAVRNMLILAVSEALYLVALCLPSGQVANGIAYVAIIIRFFRIVLDLILLISCYRMICQEGDEDMLAKEVRIPIIRKMEEVLNKRDQNAFDSARDYSEKKREKKLKKKKK